MRYRIAHDATAAPARRWLVIDDMYGLVVAYVRTKGEASAISDRLEGK